MSARLLALVTLGLGVVAIAAGLGFLLLPAMGEAGDCLAHGALIQFELAADGGDLDRIFGGEAHCGRLVIDALDAANSYDLLVFIPAYAAFSVASALFLADGALRPLSIAAVAAVLGAVAADYIETTTLLEITQTLEAPQALLPRSQAGAWSKFALLAAHGVFCAGLCFLAAKRRPILGALWLAPTLAVAAAAYDRIHWADALTPVFTLAWLGLIAVSARAALSKR